MKQLLFSLPIAFASHYEELDLLAGSTDKGSHIHNYTEAYAEYFAPLKDKPIRFLEIGIAAGGSAHLWDRYFPNAEIFMIDSDPGVLNFPLPERIHVYIVDQADPASLADFADSVGGSFDVIIDDGGHEMRQQITSLETLFPYVKPGGLYIIEDLHTSYWSSFGGNGTKEAPKAGPGTTMEYLKNLVEDLNYLSAMSGLGDWKKAPFDFQSQYTLFQKSIHSLHFYRSLCFIRKLPSE